MENSGLERKARKLQVTSKERYSPATAELLNESAVNKSKLRSSSKFREDQLQRGMDWRKKQGAALTKCCDQLMEYIQPPTKLGVGASSSDHRNSKKHHPSFHWLDQNSKSSHKDHCNELYHNKMVNVIDVTDEDSCEATADEESFYGTILEDILEIIMPSLPTAKDASVMILNGKHKYQLAQYNS